jgi:hypothetical protein
MPDFRIHRPALACAGCIIAIAVLSHPLPADARLGENFVDFRRTVLRNYRFKSESKKDVRTDSMYTLVVDQKSQEAAPGFAAGLTVSVVNGRITGQSMVLRIGDNYDAGKTLVTSHALDFAYEALGKPSTKNQDGSEKEFNAYSGAIDSVLAGQPQNLRYPGFSGVINIRGYGNGEVLITAKTDATPPPGGPEPVNK